MSGTHYLYTVTGRALPAPPRRTPSRHSTVLRLPTHRYDPMLEVAAGGRVDNPLVTDNTNHIAPEQVPNSRVVPYRGRALKKQPTSHTGKPSASASRTTATATAATATGSHRRGRDAASSSSSSSSALNSSSCSSSESSLDSPRLVRGEEGSRASPPPVEVALSDKSSARHVDERTRAALTRDQIVSDFVNDRRNSWQQKTPPLSAKNRSPDSAAAGPSATGSTSDKRKEAAAVHLSGGAVKGSAPPQPRASEKTLPDDAAATTRGPSAATPLHATPPHPPAQPAKEITQGQQQQQQLLLLQEPGHQQQQQRRQQKQGEVALTHKHKDEYAGTDQGGTVDCLQQQQQQEQQQQQLSPQPRAVSPPPESPSEKVRHTLSRSPSSPRVSHRPPPPKASTYQPQVTTRPERGQPSPPSPRYSNSLRNEEPLEERVRRYSRSPPRSAKLLGGTELLPRRPQLQGMQYDDDRYYRTIVRFIDSQPPRQQPELRAMLAEYEGREDELCDALTEAYGDDFDVMKSSLPPQRARGMLSGGRASQQALLLDYAGQRPRGGEAAGQPSCDPHADRARKLELDGDEDSGYIAADMLTPPVPTRL